MYVLVSSEQVLLVQTLAVCLCFGYNVVWTGAREGIHGFLRTSKHVLESHA